MRFGPFGLICAGIFWLIVFGEAGVNFGTNFETWGDFSDYSAPKESIYPRLHENETLQSVLVIQFLNSSWMS